MATTLLLWLLYLAGAAGVATLAAGIGRKLPSALLLASALLPLLFLLSAFTRGSTPLPVDHAVLFPPWMEPGVRGERHNVYLNDAVTQIAPWAKAVRMAYKEGSLPHRDRWNGAGLPLSGNGQSAAYSPFTVAMFALPLARAFALLAAWKLLLALTGTYLWLRELRLSSGAAAFGAVAFSLSLTVTPWLLLPHTAVIALWPWALFLVERLRDPDRSGRVLALLVLVLTIWGLAGHPESAASGAAFAAVWLVTRWAIKDLPGAPRLLARAGGAALAALGLCAFLLVPQALAILASNRIAIFPRPFWISILSWTPHGPAWWNALIMPLFPRSLGDGVEAPEIGGGAGAPPEMALGYFGIVGWACALLQARPGAKRRRTALAFLLPLAAGWGAAAGLWPFAELAALVPALKLMFPLRFFSWVALAGAAIAAFELDRLREDLPRLRSAALYAIGSAALLASAGLAVFRRFAPRHAPEAQAPLRDALVLAAASLALFAAAAAIARTTRGRLPLAPVLAAVAAGELFLQGSRLYRFGDPARLFPVTPAIEFLRSRPEPFRVLGLRATLYPNTNVFAGVEEVRTHDPVEPRAYVELLDTAAGYPPDEYFKNVRDVNRPIFDFLNVHYLVAEPGGAAPSEKWRPIYSGSDAVVFESAKALPRVLAPARIEVIEGVTPRRVAEIDDFGALALIESPGRDPALWPAGSQPSGVQIQDYRESVNRASFRVRVPDTARRAILVASLYDDGGWSAEDERGGSIPLTRANGCFLALSLPNGAREIHLRYSPPGFHLGASITALTLAALAASLLAARRAKKRGG